MNWKFDRLQSALSGENPTVFHRLKSGFAVLGDTQFLPGYCVLLRYPKIGCLNDLSMAQRSDFLLDMSAIGDAIMTVCKPTKINYEILGNTDSFLHAHIFPRYDWEDETMKKQPVWLYPKEYCHITDHLFSETKHDSLKKQLSADLKRITAILQHQQIISK